MPNNLAGTESILRFLAEEISKNTYVNIMDQYRPAYNAHLYPELARKINTHEFSEAIRLGYTMGLSRLDKAES